MKVPRLYHFSEDGHIERFEPRPQSVSTQRRLGMEGLNGPLVWAIDSAHCPLYFFPRDCPRILMWKLPESKKEDIAAYWNDSSKPMVAFFEEGWLDRINQARLFRYEFSSATFIDLNDAGMHVSKCGVTLLNVDVLEHPLARLEEAGVEMRPLPDLRPLKQAWSNSLHVSGIRLHNAKNWH